MNGNHARVGCRPASLALVLILAACSGNPVNIGGGGGGGDGSSSMSLAQRAANAGDYETAAALYQQAFDANPRSTDALLGLGRAYAGLGQYSRSEQALAEAARRNPRDPDVQLALARTQLTVGNAAAALAHLDKAGRSPRNVQALTARGIALDQLSRHKEAQEAYRQGLKIAPTDFALLSNLGLSLGLSGDTGQAIRILTDLNRDKQANATTRGNLALVYGLAGREREASAVLSRDLSSSEIQSNLTYYRELRKRQQQGKPIGNFDQPITTAARQPAKAAQPAAATAPAAKTATSPATPKLQPTQATAPVKTPVAAPPAAAKPQPAATVPLADAAPLADAFKPASGETPVVPKAGTPAVGTPLPQAGAGLPAADPAAAAR